MKSSDKKMIFQSKKCDLRLAVSLRARPEQAYLALTSARELCRWWLSGAETDARNGGGFRMVWPKSPRQADYPRGLGEKEGFFVDLEPGRKVAWMWKANDKTAPPLISFFLRPKARGCEVTLLHAGFPANAASGRQVACFRRGWEDCLAKLKLYCETGRTCKADTLSL